MLSQTEWVSSAFLSKPYFDHTKTSKPGIHMILMKIIAEQIVPC